MTVEAAWFYDDIKRRCLRHWRRDCTECSNERRAIAAFDKLVKASRELSRGETPANDPSENRRC